MNGEALSNMISIQSQLEDIHRNLKAELPDIGRIAVAIYDGQTDILKTFVHSSEGEPPFSHYEAKLEHVPSLRDLAGSQRFRIIDDLRTRADSDSSHIHRLLSQGYRSSYTTAFYDRARLFGFLFFDSREPNYFSSSVIRHLSVYSHLISLLIIHEVSRVGAIRSAIDVARKMSRTHNEETGSHLDRMARYSRIIAQALADDRPATRSTTSSWNSSFCTRHCMTSARSPFPSISC